MSRRPFALIRRSAPWAIPWAGAALLLIAPRAAGQTLAERIAQVPDGVARLAFDAKPGVRGDAHGSYFGRSTREWDGACACAGTTIHVALTLAEGRVTDVRTYVGGRWRPAGGAVTDLGAVRSAEAADYLLELVPRLEEGDAGEEAILAAALADRAIVWPRLLELARERSLRRDARETAIFWLGQAAAQAATAGLEEMVEADTMDRELREHAIFALSQRPEEEGVPALIRVVRTNPDAVLKEKALFWLGQSGDPRAIALFEQILTRR